MLVTETQTFVRSTTVLDALGICGGDQQWFYEQECAPRSWGDAVHTLVGNSEYLAVVIEAFSEESYGEDSGYDITPEKFWDLVPADAMIDLEN